MTTPQHITVGVLAVQGAFSEHIELLKAATIIQAERLPGSWRFLQVRTIQELRSCDALVIPGGESTTISLVAERSGLLEPLRDFVKVQRKPTWGTCAGLILLAESANRTKKGGQELIGGLDVRVNRNHFGRQTESFTTDIGLPFLPASLDTDTINPFRAVFIRAPIVEKTLAHASGVQEGEAKREDTVVAPSKEPTAAVAAAVRRSEVEVLARLPRKITSTDTGAGEDVHDGDIIAVRQNNCFGTSFHPELTGDCRIHAWWLQQVVASLEARETPSG